MPITEINGFVIRDFFIMVLILMGFYRYINPKSTPYYNLTSVNLLRVALVGL